MGIKAYPVIPTKTKATVLISNTVVLFLPTDVTAGRFFCYISQNVNGPWPMHEVVPSAVSAAVSAAIAMRITVSQKLFFFIRF